MKKIKVLILGGKDDTTLYTIRALAQIPEWEIHLVSENRWIPARFSRHISTYQAISSENEAWSLDAVLQAIKRTQADILLPVRVRTRKFAASHLEALSNEIAVVPLPEADLIHAFDDKGRAAEFFTQHGIPCPDTILLTDLDTLEHDLTRLSFPVILKPRTGTDGAGMEVFHDQDSIQALLTRNDFDPARFILQEFLDGYVLSCNTISIEGKILAYFICKWVYPGIVDFSYPRGHINVDEPQMNELMNKWAAASDWNGVFNLNCLFDQKDGRIKLMEVNPRYGMAAFGAVPAGVNVFYLDCLAGLGIPFEKPDYKLTPFIYTKTAIEHKLKQLLGKKKIIDFSFFRDTSLKYDIVDPLPELYRIIRLAGKRFSR